MTGFDYIIIGGGIVGMTTARELAARGASVALIEKGALGQEASWAAGGYYRLCARGQKTLHQLSFLSTVKSSILNL